VRCQLGRSIDRGEAALGSVEALLDRGASLDPFAPRDLAFGPQLSQLIQLLLGALDLSLPLFAGGIGRDAAVQGSRKFGGASRWRTASTTYCSSG
jgi:hypothetical protein